MHVLDNAHAAWYLLAEGEALFLDVNCNHSAFGYSVLIELDSTERTHLSHAGVRYLDELSRAIQDSAPLVNAHSPYRPRDLTKTRRGDVSDAIRRWRASTDPAAGA